MLAHIVDLRLCALMSLRRYVLAFLSLYVPAFLSRVSVRWYVIPITLTASIIMSQLLKKDLDIVLLLNAIFGNGTVLSEELSPIAK